MSLAQISATQLLCHLLEGNPPEINGQVLCTGEHAEAGSNLLRERLLVIGTALKWVTCPECGVETARVVRDLAHEQILLLCPRCSEISASRKLQQTYKVSLPKIVNGLMTGLDMTVDGKKEIDRDLSWRLGTTEPSRGKPLTWYFARLLGQPRVAQRLRDQIVLEKTGSSCRIITSSELPLPPGSPMTGMDVINLASIARIGQSRFEFFKDRVVAPGPQILEEASPGTTLKYVDAHTKVYIDGEPYDLEPRHRSILLALINDFDHEMDNDSLKSACGSEAQRFSPSKEFDRVPAVYRTFIRYQRGDKRYALIIPEEDRCWLH
jgi:hypothetical protein